MRLLLPKLCRLGVLLFVLPWAFRSAPAETFLVNPDQSVITFSLGTTLHQVHGTFRVQSGSVQFGRNSPQLSGSIVVAAGSGNSGDERRDHRMKAEILNVPEFAEVTFTPKHLNGTIAVTGDSSVQVDGVFTLHGSPHDLTLPMQIHIDGATCTAKTHFIIPYVKWGLKDASTFILRADKEVDIEITLVGRLANTPQ
jgi:polyisoprenoid-binding protein YceI